ncbi:MAG: glutathione S-transferase [Myxococcota bacterium]
MRIKVHHLNHSRSLRALWLLEELELDYDIQHWTRDENFRAPEEAISVHPLGRFPMVEVDGRVLVESGAVLEYFADRYERLRPTDEEEQLECRFFLHYSEGSVQPPLLVRLLFARVRSAPLPFFVKPIANKIADRVDASYTEPEIDLHLGFVEKTLSERPYFAGNTFSIADIQMIYAVEAGLSNEANKYPNMLAWRDRIAARPAFQRAEAKGGKAVPEAA